MGATSSRSLDVSIRALGPRSLTTSAATLASAPAPGPSRTPSSSTAFRFVSWRRPDEGKIHRYRLVKQLCSVERFDGGFGFRLGRILDKCVALVCHESASVLKAYIRSSAMPKLEYVYLHVASSPVQVQM